MLEPLTPEQSRLIETKYPHEVAALCRAKLRYLWEQFATPDDALQAATLGLLHAVRTFDPERGCVFNTLLHYAMKSAMERELAKGAGKLVVINKSREKGRRKLDVKTASLATLASAEFGQWEPPDASNPLGEFIDREHARIRVSEILGTVNYDEAELLHDRYFRGLSIAEIAWSRQKKRSTLRMRIVGIRERAKRDFRRAAV
jgi:RNA polymerase sigma factor (sigma-70 family)